MSSTLRVLIDFGPLAAFFIAYKLGGIMAATAVMIPVALLAVAITYWKEKKIPPMPLISAIAVTVFGGLTLYLDDGYFIKIKPTLVNMVFSAILLGGVAFGRPMLKYLLGHALQMDDRGWLVLSRRWGIFFLFLAGLNEVIWRHFSEEFWVNFKVFGMFTLTILFTIAQLPLMQRHLLEEETGNEPKA